MNAPRCPAGILLTTIYKHLSVRRLCRKHELVYYGTVTGRHYRSYSSLHPTSGWKICFFGTDDFALSSLQALSRNRIPEHQLVHCVDVVTSSQNSAVGEFSNEHGLSMETSWPVNIEKDKYDIGVVVSFGHLIPERIITAFKYGVVNVHPSLLPRWRGAAPIVHTILHGDRLTGVSVTEILPKRFDIGPVLLQEKYAIPKNYTSVELRRDLAEIGAKLLMNVLSDFERVQKSKVFQNHDGATHAHKISVNISYVDWQNSKVCDVWAKYRALYSIFDLRSYYKNHIIRLLNIVEPTNEEIVILGNVKDIREGTPVFCKTKKILYVRCKDGWIGCQEVVYKKKMSALAFYNGYLTKAENAEEIFTSINS
ncbi:methionyl-tRNA formyltransferase, mitochondrial-like [Tubulanus polymorphus]|uniref:methionyl-tRNA formyltransferase, mitochondrial-like n=1 Tax=Tubulanus polymorphus TaxID=672921 RepID=UPI003DA361F2